MEHSHENLTRRSSSTVTSKRSRTFSATTLRKRLSSTGKYALGHMRALVDERITEMGCWNVMREELHHRIGSSRIIIRQLNVPKLLQFAREVPEIGPSGACSDFDLQLCKQAALIVDPSDALDQLSACRRKHTRRGKLYSILKVAMKQRPHLTFWVLIGTPCRSLSLDECAVISQHLETCIGQPVRLISPQFPEDVGVFVSHLIAALADAPLREPPSRLNLHAGSREDGGQRAGDMDGWIRMLCAVPGVSRDKAVVISNHFSCALDFVRFIEDPKSSLNEKIDFICNFRYGAHGRRLGERLAEKLLKIYHPNANPEDMVIEQHSRVFDDSKSVSSSTRATKKPRKSK